MTEIATEAAQYVLLWSAAHYHPGLAIMGLSAVITTLLFVGTSAWWWQD